MSKRCTLIQVLVLLSSIQLHQISCCPLKLSDMMSDLCCVNIVACQRGGVSIKTPKPPSRAETRSNYPLVRSQVDYPDLQVGRQAIVAYATLYVLTDFYCTTCIRANGLSKIKRRYQHWTYFN